MLDPLVNRVFEWETRQRFAAMAAYLGAVTKEPGV